MYFAHLTLYLTLRVRCIGVSIENMRLSEFAGSGLVREVRSLF